MSAASPPQSQIHHNTSSWVVRASLGPICSRSRADLSSVKLNTRPFQGGGRARGFGSPRTRATLPWGAPFCRYTGVHAPCIRSLRGICRLWAHTHTETKAAAEPWNIFIRPCSHGNKWKHIPVTTLFSSQKKNKKNKGNHLLKTYSHVEKLCVDWGWGVLAAADVPVPGQRSPSRHETATSSPTVDDAEGGWCHGCSHSYTLRILPAEHQERNARLFPLLFQTHFIGSH